ncbi:MAG: hypothetical protein RLZZ163_469, partial [Actinomycetota bacterium]
MDNMTDHPSRRTFLRYAGTGVVVAGLGPRAAGSPGPQAPALRWGVVGTGSIANSMAGSIQRAQGAELAAVSSRRMET